MQNSKNEDCIICLENKEIYIKCIQCNECSVCINCYHEIFEDPCPICRKEDWALEIYNITEIFTIVNLINTFSTFFFYYDYYKYYRGYISKYFNQIFTEQ